MTHNSCYGQCANCDERLIDEYKDRVIDQLVETSSKFSLGIMENRSAQGMTTIDEMGQSLLALWSGIFDVCIEVVKGVK